MLSLRDDLEDLLGRVNTLSLSLPRGLLIVTQIFLPALSPLVIQDIIAKMIKDASQHINSDQLQKLVLDPPHDIAFRIFLDFRQLQLFFKGFSSQIILHLFQHMPKDPSSISPFLYQVQDLLSRSDQSSLEFFNQNKNIPKDQRRFQMPSIPHEVLDFVVNLFHFMSSEEVWAVKTWFQNLTNPHLGLLSSLLQMDLSSLFLLRSVLIDPRPGQKRARECSSFEPEPPTKFQRTEPYSPDQDDLGSLESEAESGLLSDELNSPPPEDFFENFFLESLPEQVKVQKEEFFVLETHPPMIVPVPPKPAEVRHPPLVQAPITHVYPVAEPFRTHLTSITSVPPVPITLQTRPVSQPSSNGMTRSKRTPSPRVQFSPSTRTPPAARETQPAFPKIEPVTTEPMPESGPAYQIVVQKQPPAQTVYQRILKPCPSVLVSSLTAPESTLHNLFVEATLLRSDCSQELPNCLEGTRVVPFGALNFANFTKLKIISTSQQQGSLFRLRFQLKRYQGNVFTNLPYSVLSEPIQVFSHTYYLSKKPPAA